MVNQRGETLTCAASVDSHTMSNALTITKASTENAMDAFLSSIGLYRKPVAKDGSCLFRVVAEQVYHTQVKHFDVRKNCVKFMRDNKQLFQGFVEGSFEHHLFNLQNPKEWAGQVEIFALSLLYKRDFIVYQSVDAQPTKVTSNGFKEKIYLCYSNGNHYDCVYPKKFQEDASMVQALLFEHLYTTVFQQIEERELLVTHNNKDNGCANGWTEVKSKGVKGKITEDGVPSLSFAEQASQWEKTRSLDPNVYRNIELEVWEQSRRDQQLGDRAIAAHCQYRVGDSCKASLKKVANMEGYFKAKIEDVIEEQSLFLVFVPELNQNFPIALEDLRPVVSQDEEMSYRDLPGYYRKSESTVKENEFQPSKKKGRNPKRSSSNEDIYQGEEGRRDGPQRPYSNKAKDSNFRHDSGRKGFGSTPLANQMARNKQNEKAREDDGRQKGTLKKGAPFPGGRPTSPRIQHEVLGKDEESKQSVERDGFIASRGKVQDGAVRDKREKRPGSEGKSYKRDRNQFDRKPKIASEGARKDEAVTQMPIDTAVETTKGKPVVTDKEPPVTCESVKSEASGDDDGDSTDDQGGKGRPVTMKQNFETPADFYSRMRKKQSNVPSTGAKGTPAAPTATNAPGSVPKGKQSNHPQPKANPAVPQNGRVPAIIPKLQDAEIGLNNGQVETPMNGGCAAKIELLSEQGASGPKEESLKEKTPAIFELSDTNRHIPVSKSKNVGCANTTQSKATTSTFSTVRDNDRESSLDDIKPPETVSGSKRVLEDNKPLRDSNITTEAAVDSVAPLSDQKEATIHDAPTEGPSFDVDRNGGSPLSFMDTDTLMSFNQPVPSNSFVSASFAGEVNGDAVNGDHVLTSHQQVDDLPEERVLSEPVSGTEVVCHTDEKPPVIESYVRPKEESNVKGGLDLKQGYDYHAPMYEEQADKRVAVDFDANMPSVTFTKAPMPEQKIRILRKDEKLCDVEPSRGAAVENLKPLSDLDSRPRSTSPNDEASTEKPSLSIINDGNKEKKTKKVSFGEVKFSDCTNPQPELVPLPTLIPGTEVDAAPSPMSYPPMTSGNSLSGLMHVPVSGMPSVPCQGGYGLPMKFIPGSPHVPTSVAMDGDGIDLPEDRATVKFFFDLGVQYFYMMQQQMHHGFPGMQMQPPVQPAMPPTTLPFVPNSDSANIPTESLLNSMAPPFRPQSSMNQRMHQVHRYQHPPQHKSQPTQYQPPMQPLPNHYPQHKFRQDATVKEVAPRFRNQRRGAGAGTGSVQRMAQDGNQQRQGRRGLIGPSDASMMPFGKNQGPLR